MGDEFHRVRLNDYNLSDFGTARAAIVAVCGDVEFHFEAAENCTLPWTEETHGLAMHAVLAAEEGSRCLRLTSGHVDQPCALCTPATVRQIASKQTLMQQSLVTYTIRPPPSTECTEIQEKELPMAVFVVDISASMSTVTNVEDGVVLPSGVRTTSVSRLQCVQTAVQSQIEALRNMQPDCPIAILPFSSGVTIMTESHSTTLSGNAITNSSLLELLQKGASFAAKSANGVTDTAALVKKVWALRPNGCTALGPALALGVGLCPAGGRVIACTDGMANCGVGSINGAAASGAQFYSDIAEHAAKVGVAISVVTMEGENCAMEHLGTTADLSGGQVEIVDPVGLETRVSSIVAQRTLATSVAISVRGSPNLRIDGGVSVLNRQLGAVSSDSDISFALALQAGTNENTSHARVEVQMRYTGKDAGEYLAVATEDIAISCDRAEIEHDMDPEILAIGAIQRAARMAQEGSYRAARSELISTQRLLQRGMGSSRVQQAYLPFIMQAEKLDQFIREREAQEVIGARSAERRRADRDDEAARAIYQMKSISLARFRRDD